MNRPTRDAFRFLGWFLRLLGVGQFAGMLLVIAINASHGVNPMPGWGYAVLALACALYWLLGSFLIRLGKVEA